MKNILHNNINLKIFLIDAVGAFVSILLLFGVYTFEEAFGMPKNALSAFVLIASGCLFYSSTMYFISPLRWELYLKIIAVVNITYCLFTVYHILYNSETLTLLGYLYFIGEVFVILSLSIIELKISIGTKNIIGN